MSEIRGRTALVTGGASGIGVRIGADLLRRGAERLIVWDVDESALSAAVESLAAEVAAASGDVGLPTSDIRGAVTVSGTRVDLSSLDEIRHAARSLREAGLEIDLLVNNAGIVVGKEFALHSHGEIAASMSVNALAPMHVTRELLPGMLQRNRGHIVNIASAAGMVSNPKMSVYCASKWAMIGWSDSLRLELERSGSAVRVTTVTPYYIDTGMFAGVRSALIPILDADDAVRRILRAVERDEIFLRMPRIVGLVPLLRGLLPARWFDRIVGDWLGVYRSMDEFRGKQGGE